MEDVETVIYDNGFDQAVGGGSIVVPAKTKDKAEEESAPADIDGDGVGDNADTFPEDPTKTTAGDEVEGGDTGEGS